MRRLWCRGGVIPPGKIGAFHVGARFVDFCGDVKLTDAIFLVCAGFLCATYQAQ